MGSLKFNMSWLPNVKCKMCHIVMIGESSFACDDRIKLSGAMVNSAWRPCTAASIMFIYTIRFFSKCSPKLMVDGEVEMAS